MPALRNVIVGGGDQYAGFDAFEILTALGLTSGLLVCLDAGDSTSYSGSGQTWADLSGNGNDWHLGAGSGASTDDPTFNGTAGRLSVAEYFSVDGGDFFTIKSQPSAFDDFHQLNGAGTILLISRGPDGSGNQPLFSDMDADGDGIGVWLVRTAAEKLNFRCADNGLEYADTSTDSIPANTWGLVGVAFDENAQTGTLYVHGADEAMTTVNYPSPSASGANGAARVGTQADGTDFLQSGYRVAVVMIWSTELSVANLDAINAAFGGRYGW